MAYLVTAQFSIVSDESAWTIPVEAQAILKVEELLQAKTDWVRLVDHAGVELFDSQSGVDKLWIRHLPFAPTVRSRRSPLAERSHV